MRPLAMMIALIGATYLTACGDGSNPGPETTPTLDSCASAPCGAGTCSDAGAGDYTCDCPSDAFDDGTTCVACAAINGCATLTCTAAGDSTCRTCSLGYALDGATCRDIDDCADAPCGNGSCTDRGVDAYACACDPGYYDSGATCIACGALVGCASATCTTATDAVCATCSDGFTSDGAGGCQVIGGCATAPCGNGTCTETGGVYTCACPAGEFFDASTCSACLAVSHCAAATCTDAERSTCVTCDSGFAVNGEGECLDADDCNPNPCATGNCVDTGTNAHICRPAEILAADVGGVATVETAAGTFSVTAGPGVFVDAAGEPVAGDVTLRVTLGGFDGSFTATGGKAFSPVITADVVFVDGLGNVVNVAPGRTVTLALPLPTSSGYEVGARSPLHYFDVSSATWVVESTGTVVQSNGDELALSATASHFTWYAVGATCQPLAGCDHVDCGASRCLQCSSGFGVADNGTCLNSDDCGGNACGAGTCIDAVNGYTCNCPDGTFGDGTASCTACAASAVAGCSAVTCSGPGVSACVACDAGYAFKSGTCTDIDDCVPGACGAGTCTDTGVNAYTCDCPAGAFGDGTRSCATCTASTVTGCSAVTCSAAGRSTCTACSAGYTFAAGACNNIDDCATDTCGVGTCRDGVATYTCDCPDGTFGDGTKSCAACAASTVPGCSAVTCTRAGASTCAACGAGYNFRAGACDNINDCVGSPCGAGTCIDGLSAFTCDCPDGMYGDGTTACATCAASSSAGCSAVTCTGAGASTCVACAAGFTLSGGACVDVNDCAANPCGAGTCTDTGASSWTCNCPDGSFGDGTTACNACTAIAGCTALTCTGAGASTCSACGSGFALAGGTCTNLDDCSGNTCGVGVCVDGVNAYTCDCPNGMFGDGTTTCVTCETITHCTAVTCTSAANQVCATCELGYDPSGATCQDHDDCAPNPCNGGICSDTGTNAHVCACPDGMFGDGTSTCTACSASAVPGCSAVTCSAAGASTCVACGSGYTFNAGVCDDIDDCASSPCGAGICTDTGANAWSCDCPDGTFGDGATSCMTCTPSGVTGCSAVTCVVAGVSTCAACGSGYTFSTGACDDIDDCNPNPCSSGTCVDTGPNAHICDEGCDINGFAGEPFMSVLGGSFGLQGPDGTLSLEFYSVGEGGLLPTAPSGPGDYELAANPDDRNYATCTTCALLRSPERRFFATSGTIRVNAIDVAGRSINATLVDATFVEVTIDPVTFVSTPVSNGLEWCVGSVEIDYQPECLTDDDCSAPAPFCKTSAAKCGECRDGFDCNSASPACNSGNDVTVCRTVDLCTDDDANEPHDDGPTGANVLALDTVVEARICGASGNESSWESDWYVITLEAVSDITVSLDWMAANDLDFVVWTELSEAIGLGTSSDANPEFVSLARLPAGTYYVAVNSYLGASPIEAIDYSLSVATFASACAGANPCNGGTCTDTGFGTYTCDDCPSGTFNDGITCVTCECDDADECTIDTCHPLFGCQHRFAPNGTTCTSGVVGWGDAGDWGPGDSRQRPNFSSGIVAISASKWSQNSVALRGDGTVYFTGYDEGLPAPADLRDLQAIATGDHHRLAVTREGTVIAWGANDVGQASVPDGLVGVKAVAAGFNYSLALRWDGTVVGWGAHDAGQVPLRLTDEEDNDEVAAVGSISAGAFHALAIRGTSAVAAWGDNTYNQRNVPEQLHEDWNGPYVEVRAVAAGGGHSLALIGNGAVLGWGRNDDGQATPPPSVLAIAIAAGYNHSLALRANGTVVAWGNNEFAQTDVPAGLTDVIAIEAGTFVSYALKRDGSVVSWGSGSGQFCPEVDLAGVVAISAGCGGQSIGLKDDGTVVAWSNRLGYCVPEINRRSVPAGLSDVRAIAAGCHHNLALRNDGTVVAWGDTDEGFDFGQLDVPQDLADVTAIAAGGYHSVALTRDGSVIAWGNNTDGQVDVPNSLSNVIAIEAGAWNVVAITADGSVVSWGYSPIPENLSHMAAIASGAYHALGLNHDGTVSAWGVGPYDEHIVPQELSSVTAISTSNNHNLAIKTDGSVVAWGWNESGQTNVPVISRAYAISAGYSHSLALVGSDLAISSLRWIGGTGWIRVQGAGLVDVTSVRLAGNVVRWRVISPTQLEFRWPGGTAQSPLKIVTNSSSVSSSLPIAAP